MQEHTGHIPYNTDKCPSKNRTAYIFFRCGFWILLGHNSWLGPRWVTKISNGKWLFTCTKAKITNVGGHSLYSLTDTTPANRGLVWRSIYQAVFFFFCCTCYRIIFLKTITIITQDFQINHVPSMLTWVKKDVLLLPCFLSLVCQENWRSHILKYFVNETVSFISETLFN